MTGYGKLSARAYTKSGDKEVYDGTISGLDQNSDYGSQYNIIIYDDGNYSIDTDKVFAPGGNDVQPVELPFSLTTEYHGIKCEFKWNKPKVTITKYVISIINGPSYDYDDSKYTNTGGHEYGTINISDYKCINVVAYYSDNTSKTLSFDDSDNPGFSIYVSYNYYKWIYYTSSQTYYTENNDTLYTYLSSSKETYIGYTSTFVDITNYDDDREIINKDEGDKYQFFKIIDGITQINGIPVEH